MSDRAKAEALSFANLAIQGWIANEGLPDDVESLEDYALQSARQASDETKEEIPDVVP